MLKNKSFQDLIDITLRRMDHDRDGRISFSDFATTVQVQNPGYNQIYTSYQLSEKHFLSLHCLMIMLMTTFKVLDSNLFQCVGKSLNLSLTVSGDFSP